MLYQSARSETVNLLTDTVTGETNYWFRSWSDSTGRGGRRSALYDKDGNEVMAFDGEQSATIQNGLLVLQAVSYTHLDVYKRQVPRPACRCSTSRLPRRRRTRP